MARRCYVTFTVFLFGRPHILPTDSTTNNTHTNRNHFNPNSIIFSSCPTTILGAYLFLLHLVLIKSSFVYSAHSSSVITDRSTATCVQYDASSYFNHGFSSLFTGVEDSSASSTRIPPNRIALSNILCATNTRGIGGSIHTMPSCLPANSTRGSTTKSSGGNRMTGVGSRSTGTDSVSSAGSSNNNTSNGKSNGGSDYHNRNTHIDWGFLGVANGWSSVAGVNKLFVVGTSVFLTFWIAGGFVYKLYSWDAITTTIVATTTSVSSINSSNGTMHKIGPSRKNRHINHNVSRKSDSDAPSTRTTSSNLGTCGGMLTPAPSSGNKAANVVRHDVTRSGTTTHTNLRCTSGGCYRSSSDCSNNCSGDIPILGDNCSSTTGIYTTATTISPTTIGSTTKANARKGINPATVACESRADTESDGMMREGRYSPHSKLYSSFSSSSGTSISAVLNALLATNKDGALQTTAETVPITQKSIVRNRNSSSRTIHADGNLITTASTTIDSVTTPSSPIISNTMVPTTGSTTGNSTSNISCNHGTVNSSNADGRDSSRRNRIGALLFHRRRADPTSPAERPCHSRPTELNEDLPTPSISRLCSGSSNGSRCSKRCANVVIVESHRNNGILNECETTMTPGRTLFSCPTAYPSPVEPDYCALLTPRDENDDDVGHSTTTTSGNNSSSSCNCIIWGRTTTNSRSSSDSNACCYLDNASSITNISGPTVFPYDSWIGSTMIGAGGQALPRPSFTCCRCEGSSTTSTASTVSHVDVEEAPSVSSIPPSALAAPRPPPVDVPTSTEGIFGCPNIHPPSMSQRQLNWAKEGGDPRNRIWEFVYICDPFATSHLLANATYNHYCCTQNRTGFFSWCSANRSTILLLLLRVFLYAWLLSVWVHAVITMFTTTPAPHEIPPFPFYMFFTFWNFTLLSLYMFMTMIYSIAYVTKKYRHDNNMAIQSSQKRGKIHTAGGSRSSSENPWDCSTAIISTASISTNSTTAVLSPSTTSTLTPLTTATLTPLPTSTFTSPPTAPITTWTDSNTTTVVGSATNDTIAGGVDSHFKTLWQIQPLVNWEYSGDPTKVGGGDLTPPCGVWGVHKRSSSKSGAATNSRSPDKPIICGPARYTFFDYSEEEPNSPACLHLSPPSTFRAVTPPRCRLSLSLSPRRSSSGNSRSLHKSFIGNIDTVSRHVYLRKPRRLSTAASDNRLSSGSENDSNNGSRNRESSNNLMVVFVSEKSSSSDIRTINGSSCPSSTTTFTPLASLIGSDNCAQQCSKQVAPPCAEFPGLGGTGWRVYRRFLWMLFQQQLTGNLIVTVGFWVLTFPRLSPALQHVMLGFSLLTQHAFNLVFIVLECAANRLPVEFSNAGFVMVTSLLYLLLGTVLYGALPSIPIDLSRNTTSLYLIGLLALHVGSHWMFSQLTRRKFAAFAYPHLPAWLLRHAERKADPKKERKKRSLKTDTFVYALRTDGCDGHASCKGCVKLCLCRGICTPLEVFEERLKLLGGSNTVEIVPLH